MTRRDFLRLATSTMAGPAIGWSKPARQLPIAVSTLGCPKWDWNTIVTNTSGWGFAAHELRGIQDQMDLPKCAEFSGTRLKGTLQDLSAAGLSISDLGASAQMHEPDPAKRAKHMDEARRFIDLAHQLHAPYVRVFPNQFIPGYYCFEWEKRWHPDIDEPEVAFPHYAKTMREYLSEAGISAWGRNEPCSRCRPSDS